MGIHTTLYHHFAYCSLFMQKLVSLKATHSEPEKRHPKQSYTTLQSSYAALHMASIPGSGHWRHCVLPDSGLDPLAANDGCSDVWDTKNCAAGWAAPCCSNGSEQVGSAFVMHGVMQSSAWLHVLQSLFVSLFKQGPVGSAHDLFSCMQSTLPL